MTRAPYSKKGPTMTDDPTPITEDDARPWLRRRRRARLALLGCVALFAVGMAGAIVLGGRL